MIATLKDILRGRNGGFVVSFETPVDCSELFDDLRSGQVDITIKKWFAHRTRDANAFAWVLIDQITDKLQQKEPWAGWKPVDVYRNSIRDIAGISTIVGIKTCAVETFRRNWEHGHLGRQVVVLEEGAKEGWSSVNVFYGSSDFNTEQMSRLINGLIQEAEQLGIPTITEKQEKKLISGWAKKRGEAA